MGIQDQTGATNLNPPSTPDSQMQPDVRTSNFDGGDEHNLKVRKPYIITKQRERWAEEEHEKFLEALQLYGRAWRCIEEHIGTKTAVQIRSHAQKFFSKVVRESAADSTGNAKPIEIPPPRPKRKPSHPYPRKLANTCSKVDSSVRKLGSSLSPTKSALEQENGSPTSVLSRVGFHPRDSSVFSNLQNSCTSPATSAAGSNEHEPCVEEEDDVPSLATEVGMSCEDQVPCLKLFGKTVLMNDSRKPSSSAPSIRSEEPGTRIDSGPPARAFVQDATPLGLSANLWNPWSGGMFPLLYHLPSATYGDIMNPAEARIIPLPWWGPFPFVGQQYKNSTQITADIVRQKEGSCTGSNTATASNGVTPCDAAEHCENADKKLQHRENADKKDCTAARSKRSGLDSRGFVPYKRCTVEKEVEQLSHNGVADDGEGQSVALCL